MWLDNLGGDDEGSCQQPGGPAVAIVPEKQPCCHFQEDDVTEVGHEEPGLHLEQTLGEGEGGRGRGREREEEGGGGRER